MFTVRHTSGYAYEVMGTYNTLDEALNSLPGKMIQWEEDSDNPGYYDAATTHSTYWIVKQ